jgi:hypothetical protein
MCAGIAETREDTYFVLDARHFIIEIKYMHYRKNEYINVNEGKALSCGVDVWVDAEKNLEKK